MQSTLKVKLRQVQGDGQQLLDAVPNTPVVGAHEPNGCMSQRKGITFCVRILIMNAHYKQPIISYISAIFIETNFRYGEHLT
jgi:hypothetical protein